MSRRAAVIALEVAVPVALLAAWWVWSAGSTTYYFPPLTNILTSFENLWLFERIAPDVLPSLARMFAGFALASVAAVALGLLLGQSRTAYRLASPIVEFLRAIPPPALLPFGILVLGVGDGMKIAIIALVCLFPVLLNTVDGVRGVDPLVLETARAYGIRGLERLRRVVLPSALPQVFAGMRTALSLALILMVISEMVASTNGIGYFVLQSQRSFAVADMWAGILLIGLLGYALNGLFVLVERRVLGWHRGARGGARA